MIEVSIEQRGFHQDRMASGSRKFMINQCNMSKKECVKGQGVYSTFKHKNVEYRRKTPLPIIILV